MKRIRGCSQREIPVHKRKELEFFQVKTRTMALLWEWEVEEGNRKSLLEVIMSKHKDIRILKGHLQDSDATQKDDREETNVVDE